MRYRYRREINLERYKNYSEIFTSVLKPCDAWCYNMHTLISNRTRGSLQKYIYMKTIERFAAYCADSRQSPLRISHGFAWNCHSTLWVLWPHWRDSGDFHWESLGAMCNPTFWKNDRPASTVQALSGTFQGLSAVLWSAIQWLIRFKKLQEWDSEQILFLFSPE